MEDSHLCLDPEVVIPPTRGHRRRFGRAGLLAFGIATLCASALAAPQSLSAVAGAVAAPPSLAQAAGREPRVRRPIAIRSAPESVELTGDEAGGTRDPFLTTEAPPDATNTSPIQRLTGWLLLALAATFGLGPAVIRSVGAAGNNRRKRSAPAAATSKGFAAKPSSSSAAAAAVKGATPPSPARPASRRPPLPPKGYPAGPLREVPAHIPRPSYAADGQPKERPSMFFRQIEVKNAAEIEQMRKSCRLAREVLDIAVRAVKPGISTDEIDVIVHEAIISRNAYPSPLNYNKFPKSVCTSLNEVVCHGIPDRDTILKEGDIINIDVTLFFEGFHGDCSEMVFVGKVDEAAQRLVKSTYEAWQAAIAICKPGVPYQQIGRVIEERAKADGFCVSEMFIGHGIGRAFHTAPNVFHHTNDIDEGVMRPGHTFTIEPILAETDPDARKWPDRWTYATIDHSWAAQFEHTLLITEEGVEALTAKLPTSPVQPWERPGAF
eukprot:EG_transcript_2967